MGFLDKFKGSSNDKDTVPRPSAPAMQIAPPTYDSTHLTPLVCISLYMSDMLRIINFSPQMYAGLRQTILQNWNSGIQNEQSCGGVPEIKLRGNPWWGQNAEAVPARVLMTAILEFMYQSGWGLLLSADLSKKPTEKDSLYFQPVTPIPGTMFFSISFNLSDRIRLIGAPPHIVGAVQQCVRSRWHRGIQEEKDYYGAHEIKLRGNPWWSDGEETVITRILVLSLLQTLEANGYRIYASLDISGMSSEHQSDLHSWFFKSIPPLGT